MAAIPTDGGTVLSMALEVDARMVKMLLDKRTPEVGFSAMIRYVLEFCFCSPDNLSPSQEKKWDKEWTGALKQLAFWSNGLGDYKVDLTPPRGQEFLQFLHKARKAGARLNGIGLEEELQMIVQSNVEACRPICNIDVTGITVVIAESNTKSEFSLS